MKTKFLAGLSTGVFLLGMAGMVNATEIYSNTDIGDRSANDFWEVTLTDLDVHTEVSVSFDLYIYDSWDGTGGGSVAQDFFGFSVDGGFQEWTFDNFYPNPANETNTDVADTSGNFNSINTWGAIDRQFVNYMDGFNSSHNTDTLTLRFYGKYLQGMSDESWGVRNILVSSNADQLDPVPEPATMLLFCTGLLGLVGSRLRKKEK